MNSSELMGSVEELKQEKRSSASFCTVHLGLERQIAALDKEIVALAANVSFSCDAFIASPLRGRH